MANSELYRKYDGSQKKSKQKWEQALNDNVAKAYKMRKFVPFFLYHINVFFKNSFL